MFRLARLSLVLGFLSWLPDASAVARADDFVGILHIHLTDMVDGRQQFTFTGTVDPLGDVMCSDTPADCSFVFDGTTGQVSDGRITMVDTGGSTLMMTFEGQVALDLSLSGDFTIIGGTGDWDGATGDGTFSAPTIIADPIETSFAGTITLGG